ncbi:MAG: phage tail sheath family protein, partial [Actinomycetota bacterium]|nr:phage tail sheath family protein [Actinomycetota bacterium]
MPTYLSPGVYVEEVEAGSRPIEGVGTAVAAFVGLAAQGPFNTPTLITNWNQFTQNFGEFVEGSYLAHSVYGYFLNGGGACYVVRIGGDRSADGKGSTAKKKELTEGSQATLGSYRVIALDSGTGNTPNITVQVTDSAAENPPEGSFKLEVKRGNKVEETFDPVTTARGKDNVVTVVAERSKLIRLEETTTGAALATPEKTSVTLQPAAPPTAAPTRLAPDDYVGDVAERTGFGGLEAVDEITMLAVPDLMSAYQQGAIDAEGVQAVQLAMIAHCELMGDRMAILDPLPGLNPQQIKEWRTNGGGYDSKYAALYYPWPKVFDPSTGTNIHVPPSG